MNLSLPYLYICTFAYFLSEQIPAHTNSISLQFLLTLSLHYANTHLRFLQIKSRMLDVYYHNLVDMIYPTFFHEKCYTDAYIIPHRAQKFFSPIHHISEIVPGDFVFRRKMKSARHENTSNYVWTKYEYEVRSIRPNIIAVKSPEGVLEEHRSVGWQRTQIYVYWDFSTSLFFFIFNVFCMTHNYHR